MRNHLSLSLSLSISFALLQRPIGQETIEYQTLFHASMSQTRDSCVDHLRDKSSPITRPEWNPDCNQIAVVWAGTASDGEKGVYLSLDLRVLVAMLRLIHEMRRPILYSSTKKGKSSPMMLFITLLSHVVRLLKVPRLMNRASASNTWIRRNANCLIHDTN